MNRWINPGLIIAISASLLIAIVPVVVFYLWNEDFDSQKLIHHEKLGTFGDFIGGVLGSIWAFSGVVLFYMALVEQRADFRNNRDAFRKQIEALEVQTNEFKLQRDELAAARKVSIEQTKTLKQQRLESTYFSLLELYYKISSSLNEQSGSKNYFKDFRADLVESYTPGDSPRTAHENAIKSYNAWFYRKKDELTHYFKILYRIVRIIDDSEIELSEKNQYIKILRSQLSENEMLALYYNSQSDHGADFYKLILKYNLLKHLPSISKIEFTTYQKNEEIKPGLLRFSGDLGKQIEAFLKQRDENLASEGYRPTRIEHSIECMRGAKLMMSATEPNRIEFSFTFVGLSECFEDLGLSIDSLTDYLELLFWDLFFFSAYALITPNDGVTCNRTNDCTATFEVSSVKKLNIISDVE